MRNIALAEMKVNIRIKLMALWSAVMFFYIYGDYFALYIPREAEKLVKGDVILNTPIKLLAASVLMALPPWVIIITAMAAASFARWMNIVFGIFFTAIMLLIAFTSIDPEWIAYVFYALVESCITLVIIWQAWHWPKSVG